MIDSKFENNTGYYGGASKFLDNEYIELKNLGFIDNKAMYGGGIFSNRIINIQINECTFTNNTAN